ncbi:hypothetical protein [Chromatium okenii]|uniref:hypothetical protein n=1 Tax=Chromatium okenii TaxID=61644 RepID=UPI001F5BBEEE|nr:hypothetical protein [Chromatium okenii]
MQNEAGEVRTFIVTAIADGKLTVDGNHPLAGKSLVVHIRIQEVREPTRRIDCESSGCQLPSTSLH